MEMRQNRKDKKHPRSPGEDWTKWNPGLNIRNFLSHLTTAKLIQEHTLTTRHGFFSF